MASPPPLHEGGMPEFFQELWRDEGQDVAEYAIMLVVILALTIGTIRLIASDSNLVFSKVASSVQ